MEGNFSSFPILVQEEDKLFRFFEALQNLFEIVISKFLPYLSNFESNFETMDICCIKSFNKEIEWGNENKEIFKRLK